MGWRRRGRAAAVLALVLLVLWIRPGTSSMLPMEVALLTQIYDDLNGARWSNSDGWLAGDPCEDRWHGVACDGLPGTPDRQCTGLFLQGNNVAGHLPEKLGQLQQLRVLSFADNHLTGKLPNSLGSLQFLNTVLLSNNKLSGKLPASLFEIPTLSQVDLSHNTLDAVFDERWAQLRALTQLDLSHCGLGQTIPEALADLTALVVLDLSNNKLSGTLPASMSKMRNLQQLDVSNNKFHGYLPSLLASEQLGSLDASSNQLCWDFPDWVLQRSWAAKAINLAKNPWKCPLPDNPIVKQARATCTDYPPPYLECLPSVHPPPA